MTEPTGRSPQLIGKAKQLVVALAKDDAVAAAHQERLLTLIDSPDELTQGSRGICAMTSVVHTLLWQDLGKFMDLMQAVYRYWDDVNVGVVEVGTVRLQAKLLKQVARKLLATPGDDLDDLVEEEADFMLARALGKVFKIACPATFARLVTLNQASFTKLFAVKAKAIDLNVAVAANPDVLKIGPTSAVLLGDLQVIEPVMLQVCGYGFNRPTLTVAEEIKGKRWRLTWRIRSDTYGLLYTLQPGGAMTVSVLVTSGVRGEGDLGFDADALQELMEQVYGCEGAVMPGGNPKVITVVNQALAHQQCYSYAMVNGVVNWWAAHAAAQAGRAATDAAFAFEGAPKMAQRAPGMTAPPAEHVVVITGPIKASGNFYLVPVWTWSTRFTVRVARDQMGAYFPSIVCGFF